jgi:sulfur-oxidizing protein SoxA
MVGVRAEPFAGDSIELVELELYLGARANGLAVETPAVRP